MAMHGRIGVKAMHVWLGPQQVSSQMSRRVWVQARTTHSGALSGGQHTGRSQKHEYVQAGTLSSGLVFRPLFTTAVGAQKAPQGDDPSTDPHAEEQEREHVFTPMRERDVMERLESHSHQMSLDSVSANCVAGVAAAEEAAAGGAAAGGMLDGYLEGHGSTGGVSLSGVMQSNVPEPFRATVRGTPTHMNMPGGGSTRSDKYLAGHMKDVHPSRQYGTLSTDRDPATKEERAASLHTPNSDMQGSQGDVPKLVEQTLHLDDPCPQGVQGEDCETFKLWLNNCVRYGLPGCEKNLKEFRLGRKSLSEIFAEQERLIQEAAGRPTSAGDDVSMGGAAGQELSQTDRLKRAVKEYGATVVVFHVGISLMSLGTAYLAVSSGLDVVGLLGRLGVGQVVLDSRLAAGTGTFVLAYAVHKVFAPARIAITLTATPFIVRHLRAIGFLKSPNVK